MTGETNLDRLLRDARPRLDPDEYVFASFLPGEEPSGIDPFARVHEAEGVTWILRRTDAERAGVIGSFPSRRIVLEVHSSLDAVGFLATISARLADSGISVNAVSAFHHDHLFVPTASADAALRLLAGLRRSAVPDARAPAGVEIRTSTADDVASLHACFDSVAKEGRWLARLEAPPPEQVDRFVKRMAEGGGVQVLALRDGRVIGWCDVIRSSYPAFDHSGGLGMGIVREERGRGIGAALLAETLRLARSAGLTRVDLEVYPSNERAVRLYESFGFVREGRKRRARLKDGRAEDLLCMARVELD